MTRATIWITSAPRSWALQIYAEGVHDDQELQKVHRVIVALQSILADHAENSDAAMGITPALKHLRRTSGGGSAGPGY